MQGEHWLGLTDYASKYRISVSTLRRRIKSGNLQHRLADGRYLVPDTPPDDYTIQQNRDLLEAAPLTQAAEEKLSQLRAGASAPEANVNGEAVVDSASRLLTELKRAYMNILQEKEEQIIQLKEEVSDLKTLVRVLEEDNDRVRRLAGEAPRP